MNPRFRTCLSVLLSWQYWVTASPVAAVPNSKGGEAHLFRGVIPIEIELEPAAIQQLKSHPRDYVEGRLTIAGTQLNRIGVRLKGSTGSFQSLEQKPSLTLDLDRYLTGQSVGRTRKLHLNNSAEDPSFLNEWLGSTLFREAGIPTPSVGHARVRINGRAVGLYVLKEGSSRDFLKRSRVTASGTLLEPGPRQDIGGSFHVSVGPKDSTAFGQLKALAAILDESDLHRRQERFDQLLDRDQFARFVAMEILLGHRDGYSLARNNYRIYVSADPTSVQFVPHGMDQLLQNPNALATPLMAGDVARSWIEIPENSKLYDQTLAHLNSSLLEPDHVSHLLEEVWSDIQGALRISESKSIRAELEGLRERARLRHRFLSDHFAQPKLQPLEFQGSKVQIRGWQSTSPEFGTVIEHPQTDKSPAYLQLSLTSPGWVSVDTHVVLRPGRYRFQGRFRVQRFENLPFGKHQGVFLRIAGTDIRSKEPHRADFPKTIDIDFEIPGDAPQAKTLVCELRGQSGTAWVELDSLQIEQITPGSNGR